MLARRLLVAMQSSDGDVIHCVPSHRQPAFDHPKLRGQMPEVIHIHLSLNLCRTLHFAVPFLFPFLSFAGSHSQFPTTCALQDEPTVRPMTKGAGEEDESVFFRQAWSDGGERCPEGTVPIRRTTAQDVLRSGSARRFGMKPRAGNVRRDSTSGGHEVSTTFQFSSVHPPPPYMASL